MQYRKKRKIKASLVSSSFLFLAASVCATGFFIDSPYVKILCPFSAAFLVSSFLVIERFVLSDLVYVIRNEGDYYFDVYKTGRKKSKKIFSHIISENDIIEKIEKDRKKRKKQKAEIGKCYSSFVQEPFSKEKYYLVFKEKEDSDSLSEKDERGHIIIGAEDFFVNEIVSLISRLNKEG